MEAIKAKNNNPCVFAEEHLGEIMCKKMLTEPKIRTDGFLRLCFAGCDENIEVVEHDKENGR